MYVCMYVSMKYIYLLIFIYIYGRWNHNKYV